MSTRLELLEAELAKRKAAKRTLGGEIARAAAIGPVGLLNLGPFIGNLPSYGINAASYLAGSNKRVEPPFYYPSELAREGLEKLSGVYGAPKTLAQQALGTGVEFLTGGGTSSLASKLGKAGSFFTKGNPETLKQYGALAGGGAMAGALEHEFPEIPGIGLAGAIAGGKATQAALSPAKTAKKLTSPIKNLAQENILTGLEPEDLARKQAAEEIGVHLTPAESSGNPLMAAQQGRLGSTKQGAKDLYQYHKKRLAQETTAINNLLSDIHAEDQIVSGKTRDLAKDIIEKHEDILKLKAKPFYDKSAPQVIDQKVFSSLLQDDPIIAKAVENVLTDPELAREIKDYAPNSIKVLDEAKKRLDARWNILKREGDKHKMGLVTDAKNRLTSELDKISPDYKKARAIYSEDSPAIKALRNTEIGKIANTKDLNLDSITQTIFSPAKLDIENLRKVRNEIYKESPEMWNALVRQEMSRRINDSNVTGSSFYKKILNNERSYKQFDEALANNAKSRAKLKIMRDTFQDLIGQRSVKTAAGQSKISVDMPRNLAAVANIALDKLTGGRYDKAAIGVITSDNWDKEFFKIINDKDRKFKAIKILGLLDILEGERIQPSNAEKIESEQKTRLQLLEEELQRRKALNAPTESAIEQ